VPSLATGINAIWSDEPEFSEWTRDGKPMICV
jgi:hypothetical protein